MNKTIPRKTRVLSNRRLDKAGSYWSLQLTGIKPTRKIYPGNFVHLKITESLEPYFRRAFSVADYDPGDDRMEIIYKVVGRGTSLMAEYKKGDIVDIVGPLGNRFTYPGKKKTAIIVAGGVGFPPLRFLSQQLLAAGYDSGRILFFYGGRSREDLIELSRLKKQGVKLLPCTDNGSYGFKGFVTDAVRAQLPQLDRKNIVIFGCGPEPMLAALQNLALAENLDGEISLEAPMPCGVGVCLGCVKPRMDQPGSYVRVCYEGPVFKMDEVKL